MTDTLLDYDPNDSGGITRLPGEDRTVIIRFDTGEQTKNLREERDAILAATGRMRYGNVVPQSLVTGHGYDPEAHPGPIVDLVDTVTFHIPETIGVVADTQHLTLLGSPTATVDGDLRPAAPGPFPVPLPPNPPPAPKPGYVGRHRDPLDRVAVLGEGAWERMVEAAKPAGEPRRLRVLVGVGAFVAFWAAVTMTVLAVIR
jgi:hypothetical protein